MPDGNAAHASVAYASPVRDNYTLKQNDTSASAPGSLPIRSYNDSMQKIAGKNRLGRSVLTPLLRTHQPLVETVPRSSLVPGDAVSSLPLAPRPIIVQAAAAVVAPASAPTPRAQ